MAAFLQFDSYIRRVHPNARTSAVLHEELGETAQTSNLSQNIASGEMYSLLYMHPLKFLSSIPLINLLLASTLSENLISAVFFDEIHLFDTKMEYKNQCQRV